MSLDQNTTASHSTVEESLRSVIEDCHSIVEKSNEILKPNFSKSPAKIKCNNVTLEKVVRDMTGVLYDLKTGIKLVKSPIKDGSLYNLEGELEILYKKQVEAERKKEEEEKKSKEVAGTNNKQNQKRPVSSKPGSNRNTPIKQNANQQRIRSPEKFVRRARPSSASSQKIQNKVIVTTVNFPPENSTPNAVCNRITPKDSKRPATDPEHTLRKPSTNSPVRRVVSIPPPREVYNPLGILKDEVDRAIRDGKTFTIKGQFPAVRRSLLNRGWIEKYHASHREKLDVFRNYGRMSLTELVDFLRNKELVPIIKRLIKSKLLKDHQVDLYWDHTFEAFKECPDTKKLTIINRFRRESLSYTSKQGLCQAARDNYWLQIPGVAQINHPRCYILAKGGDTKGFLRDFGLTAATCLLKWVVRTNITGESKVVSASGKVHLATFDFAITECYKFVKREKHQDIDEEIKDAMEKEWNDFLEQFYKIVHIGNHFKLTDKTMDPSEVAKDMVRKANFLLNELREYMPCLNMDGIMNIWILKPTNSSRGEGIHICRTLQYILDIVKKNVNRRYVIQKYIERPLLIHETKFDIRQWFLVSCSYPLTIWMYKHCYLRFSCQTYNLRKLHESIHLTNNSVQAKYMKYVSRDPLLPSYGMWDTKDFKNYLSDIGYPTIYEETIYTGMKQCITGAMIAHKDKMDRRKNCFEMYGADFMLSEQFEPWLLEINSNPALHASTPVTAKMCPQVLEDVIKVVIDHGRNEQASTGNFDLIYMEKIDTHRPNSKPNFQLTGTPVPNDYFCDIPAEEAPKKVSPLPKKFATPDPGRLLLQTGETMKEALKNLLQIVKKEKMKRHSRREKGTEVKLLADVGSTQTNRELISIYQSTASRKSSGYSVIQVDSNFSSQEKLSEIESKKITEVLSEIATLQSKKQLLSNLVKVVDNIVNTNSWCMKE